MKKFSTKKFSKQQLIEDLKKQRKLREEVVSVRHFTHLTKNFGGKIFKN